MSSQLPPASKILFISAAPSDQQLIDSSGEYRAITEAVRSDFKVVTRLAARPEDLVHALAEEKPQVIHFSGHGTGKKGLAFENDKREMVLLARGALDRILKAEELMAPVRLIVLNACWSIAQARAIAKKGPDTIGMKIDVLDDVAKAFAEGFYRMLAAPMTVEGAYQAAIAATAARGLPEADSPVLVAGSRQPRNGPEGGGSIDRAALRKRLEILYPGDDLNDMIFDTFPEFATNFAGVPLPRTRLLRELLQWVLERPSKANLLETILRAKEEG